MSIPAAVIAAVVVALYGLGCGSQDSKEGTAMTADQQRGGHKNRLAKEQSPYLLQHADNPVDWYPWGEEAFARARREDKPIFLSIGYSTCHWCHVMEHESFEDSTVAALMNDAFINIKVDREERPDVDNVYMTVCQMMTGGGGWPLTIVMTPDRKPFFAATYIPKQDAYGRTGMASLVPALKEAWQTRRAEVDQSSEKLLDHLRGYAHGGAAGEEPSAETLELAHEQLRQRFDPVHGGFGNAPKFPTPHNLLFLLRYWKRSGDAGVLDMVTKTLDKMAAGGMYDHVGFGFHRYSTDTRWFAPHFEKMLYDQALLVLAYTEAFAATGDDRYRRTAEEVIEYVLRDMTSERGGFLSAEDADSEGIEGKFYLWSVDEVRKLLDDADAELFIDVYGLQSTGNFAEEVAAANILYLRRPLAETAAEMKIEESELRDRLERIRKVLYEERETRVHPYKDDKILTDWNGLMIAAMARAGLVLDNDRSTEAARRAAAFALGTLRDDKGRLLHRYREGHAGIAAHVDDYAFLIWGLLELYESTFDVGYLETALELNATMLDAFWDKRGGGLYFSAEDAEPLIVRMKEATDGAVPSGNSVAMLNLIRLARMTADAALEDRSRAIARAFGEGVTQSPTAFTFMLLAVDFAVGPSYEVVIVGKPDGTDTRAMVRALYDVYLPNKVVILKPAGEKSPRISEIAEFTRAHAAVGGQATAYVCRNYACELPTADPGEMIRSLGER